MIRRVAYTSALFTGWLFFFFFSASLNCLAISLTKEEKHYLRSKGTIIFVSQTHYPPFEFINDTHQAQGMMVDLIHWMAVEMSFQPVFESMDFKKAQEAVLAGKADVITSLFFSEKRQQKFLFTETLFDVPASIFVKADRTDIRGINDLNGKIIAIQKGDYAKEYLEAHNIHFSAIYTKDFSMAADDVIGGYADAVIGDEPIVLYHLYSNHLTDFIQKMGDPLYVGKNCMAASKDNHLLIGILNKGIDEARKVGVLNNISPKWLGTKFGHQETFINRYIWPISAAVGLLFLVFLGAWIWNVRLRTLVREKTKVIVRREEALRESEKNFRTFFNTMNDMIFVGNLDGTLLHTNSAATDKLGYSLEDFAGKSIFDVHPAESRQNIETTLTEILNKGQEYCSVPLQTKEGSLIPVETRAWTGKWNDAECFFCISKDLSKEQEAMQKFNLLFNNNPALMAVASLPEKILTEVNDAFLNTLGFSREDIIGRTFSELNLFIDPERFRIVVEGLEQEKGIIDREELQVKCKDGTILDEIISGGIIKTQGQKHLLIVMLDQTERKQMENVLRESEERFHSIFDNSPDGIIFSSADGSIFAANRAATEILGWTEQELCNGGRRLMVDDDDPKFLSAHKARSDTGKFRGELYIKRKTGEVFPMEISSSLFPFGNGKVRASIIFRDISHRKAAEENLTKIMREQQVILDNANIGISMSIGKKQIWANRKWHNLYQYSQEDREELDAGQLFPSAKAFDQFSKVASPLLSQGGIYECEQMLVRKDGTSILIKLIGRAITPSDMSQGIIWTHEDITEHNKIEEERRSWERQRQQLQKTESLNRMAGAIAHLFNNILGAVIGNLEMAVSEMSSGQPTESLQEALDASYRASEVSGLMLTYLGQSNADNTPMDLSDICQASLSELRDIPGENIDLTMDFPTPGPVIYANADQIRKVLKNLTTNAAETMESRGGTIRLSMHRVQSPEEISAIHRFPIDWVPRDTSYTCLEVADSGFGIQDKEIEQIFDPFYSTKFTGRGLGLPVVLGIVRAHGGGITVESKPDHGSIFRVFLPIK